MVLAGIDHVKSALVVHLEVEGPGVERAHRGGVMPHAVGALDQLFFYYDDGWIAGDDAAVARYLHNDAPWPHNLPPVMVPA